MGSMARQKRKGTSECEADVPESTIVYLDTMRRWRLTRLRVAALAGEGEQLN